MTTTNTCAHCGVNTCTRTPVIHADGYMFKTKVYRDGKHVELCRDCLIETLRRKLT